MYIKKLLIFILLLLNIRAYSDISIYTSPGFSFFGSSLGFYGNCGVRIYPNEFFKIIPNELLSGLELNTCGTFKENIGTFEIGGGLNIGYSFYFLEKKISLSPILYTGISYMELWNDILKRKKLGLKVKVELEFYYEIFKNFKIGLTTGYDTKIYDIPILNLYTGINFLYNIKFSYKENKIETSYSKESKIINKSDNEKKKTELQEKVKKELEDLYTLEGTPHQNTQNLSFNYKSFLIKKYNPIEYKNILPNELSKYDNAFNKVHKINQLLEEANFIIDNFSYNIEVLMNTNISFNKDNKLAIITFKEFLKNNGIKLKIESIPVGNRENLKINIIEPQAPNENIINYIQEFQNLIKTLPAINKDLELSIKDSDYLKYIFLELKSYIDNDLTNEFEKYKPEVLDRINESIKYLEEFSKKANSINIEISNLINILEQNFK